MNTLLRHLARLALLLSLPAVTATCAAPRPPDAPSTAQPPAPLPTLPSTPFVQAPQPSPTWTPLPTLMPHEAVATVQDLLLTNRGCSLPCWWGITPGRTTWQEAQHVLAPFASIEAGTQGTITIDSQTYAVQPYSVFYSLNGEAREAANIYVRAGLVSGLSLGKHSAADGFRIRDLLRLHGLPTAVLINTFSLPGPSADPDGYLPFRILVLYRDSGFMAFYNFEGSISGSVAIGCPEDTAARIHSWASDEASIWTRDRIQLVALGVDSSPLKPIAEVTSWDVPEFYSAFTTGSSQACVETPAYIW
jgi:hypothetical protein